jgi:TetR/AcrR family transcriptional regulator
VPKASRSRIAQGQPARDPEATRAQILDAAEEEFARYGLAGARVEAIAAGTGVTKAMIYYYFGNKEELYRAVLQRPASEILDQIHNLHLETLPPAEALETAIRAAITHEVTHPFQQMLLWQEATQNQGKYFSTAGWDKTFLALMSILERGIIEGVFRPVDPWLTAISIGGVCTFYFTAYDNLKHIEPQHTDLRNNKDMVNHYTQLAIDMVLNGIRTTPLD